MTLADFVFEPDYKDCLLAYCRAFEGCTQYGLFALQPSPPSVDPAFSSMFQARPLHIVSHKTAPWPRTRAGIALLSGDFSRTAW